MRTVERVLVANLAGCTLSKGAVHAYLIAGADLGLSLTMTA